MVIIDAGPLVAYLSRSDSWHEWVREQFKLLPPPLVTCEPALTEACFLVQRDGGDPAIVLQKLRDGVLQIAFDVADESPALETLMRRYSDVPMSLADACLVRLSEIHKDCRVFTLDRHFSRYRRFGRQVIPLLDPW